MPSKQKKTKAQVSRNADREMSDAMSLVSSVNCAIDSIVSALGSIRGSFPDRPSFSRANQKLAYLASLRNLLVPNLRNNMLSAADIDRRSLEREIEK